MTAARRSAVQEDLGASDHSPGGHARRRKALFTIVMTVGVWVVCETTVALGTWWDSSRAPQELEPQAIVSRYRGELEAVVAGSSPLIVHSPELGWSHRAGGSSRGIACNGQGLRSDHDYRLAPAPGRLRIAVFGDSFTLGAEVGQAESWPALLESRLGDAEVLNFGVSGYGTDQAVLRYLYEGRAFSPRIAVLAHMSENIRRLVNVFRPFYVPGTGLPFAKPRFVPRGAGLELLPNPLPTLADYTELLAHPEVVLPRLTVHDAYCSRYRRSSPSFLAQLPSIRAARYWWARLRGHSADSKTSQWRIHYETDREPYVVLERLVEHWHGEATDAGTLPVILLLPTLDDLRDMQSGREICYANLERELEARGYLVVDAAPGLLRALGDAEEPGWLFAPRSHYTARGNAVVASTVAEFLAAQGF